MTENSCFQELNTSQVEKYAKCLKEYKLSDVGSQKWLKQHILIEKLNMQAYFCASTNKQEFVHRSLMKLNKIPVLISHLICIDIWKHKLLNRFKNEVLNSKASLNLQIIVHNELTLCNLLETIMFHGEVIESADDCLIDLLDYQCRILQDFILSAEDGNKDENDICPSDTSIQAFTITEKTVRINVIMKSISLMRYCIENLERTPFCIMTRLLRVQDVPMILCKLLKLKPWLRSCNGKDEVYTDGCWKETKQINVFINKVEGQVWISLIHLIMNPEAMKYYEFNNYRKESLLQLKSHLNVIKLQQIPNLEDLLRFLEKLSISNLPSAKPLLVIEQIPKIYEEVLTQNTEKWDEIFKSQYKMFSSITLSDYEFRIKALADVYNPGILDTIISTIQNCATCHQEAEKRCSRCRNEWYCSRECQVDHWKEHQKICYKSE